MSVAVGGMPERSRTIGWAWVGMQVVLLVTLVLLGGRDDWPTPRWLELASRALLVLGLALLVVAATGLGRLLTPTPVPNGAGDLVTTGAYRFVRHPIYSGVLVVVVALVVPSGSWLTLAVGAATVGFFYAKSSWEEDRLTEHFPDYPSYRATTPRFFPRLRPRSRPTS